MAALEDAASPPKDTFAFAVRYPVPSTHQEINISLNPAIVFSGEFLEFVGQSRIETSNKFPEIFNARIFAASH